MKSELIRLFQFLYVFKSAIKRRVFMSTRDLKRFVSIDVLLDQRVATVQSREPKPKNYSKLKLVKMDRVYIDVKYQHLKSKNNKFIDESTPWPIEYILLSRSTSLYLPSRLYNRVDLNGIKIAMGSSSYYHWLIEQLPNFIRVSDSLADSTTLCWSKSPKYVFDYLKNSDLKYESVNRFLSVDNLVFLPYAKNVGNPTCEDIQILRSNFLEKFGRSKITADLSKLYISRSSSSRSPQFEKSLEELLISQEWVVVKPERLSLVEQYNLFRKAKVVMGPHGAGLANTAFMPEQSTVVELRTLIPGVFHGDEISQCYKNLSQVLGNNHISLDLSLREYQDREIPPAILTLLGELDI